MSSLFQRQYNGRFISALHWPQLDALWATLGTQSEGWYVYFIGEALPQAPLSSQALQHFIGEINTLLHTDHEHDYCGIVYADSLEQPSMIKIYDPNNLGASCGASGRRIHPRWLLSRAAPELIEDEVPTPANRKRWWQRVFHAA